MEWRTTGFETGRKPGNSPVTEADIAADRLITERLRALAPHVPIISEEGGQLVDVSSSPYFWCVDPLDGTKGFIRGEDAFTVNIALIAEHQPIAGVIYVPARGDVYSGYRQGAAAEATYCPQGGERETIQVRSSQPDARHGLISRHHRTDNERQQVREYGVVSTEAVASSWKFCLLAAGKADIYPRFGPTMEWDTAAGQAILEAAGGAVTDMESGETLRYGKPGFENPRFVAWGSVEGG